MTNRTASQTLSPPAHAPDLIAAMRAIIGEGGVFSDDKSLTVFSKDAYYYSPVLKPELDGCRADVIVAPETVAELQAVVRYACAHRVPITMRGSGTGNYGQCVPLEGGIVVSTHRLAQILDLDAATGVVRAEPGVRLGKIERTARPLGWELRCYPSTWATAALGGFVGGGFGGVGSVRNGVLWDGFIRSITVLEVTPEAKLHTISGDEIMGFIHAYGTSGIMVELEINLAPAVPWEEAYLCFPEWESALRYIHSVAEDPALDKRLVTAVEWPAPSFFRPLVDAGAVKDGQAAVLLELGEGQTGRAAELAAPWGGQVTYRAGAEQYHAGKFSLSDFTWNHTTLWAIKADPLWTYLQAGFKPEPDEALAQMNTLKAAEGDKLVFHVEYVRRGPDKELQMAALELLFDQTAQSLRAATERREAMGIEVADPHTYLLDADPRWTGAPVLRARERFNPLGLLNPGKLSARALEHVTD